MNYAVIWTKESVITFEDRIEYLKIHWTEREIKNFKKRVNSYLNVLPVAPFIGKKHERLKNVYSGFIIKQVSLIYRVNLVSKEIVLISFIDNRQNPERIARYKF